MSILAGIGAIVGGIGGLLGSTRKPKETDPSKYIRKTLNEQARGAREAGAKYGFNPLTMMQYGQAPGQSQVIGGGGAAPLASIQMLTEGLRDVNDVTSGDAARRRAADELEIDIARLKLEQARSGVVAVHPVNTTDTVGAGLSPLGRTAATHAQANVRAVPPRVTAAPPPRKGANPIAPDRKIERDPLVNSPGVFEIQNRVTGGKPVTIPGEGEPWGIDELATAVVVGAPQVAGSAMNEVLFDGKPANEWAKENREKREKKNAEEYDDIQKRREELRKKHGF